MVVTLPLETAVIKLYGGIVQPALPRGKWSYRKPYFNSATSTFFFLQKALLGSVKLVA